LFTPKGEPMLRSLPIRDALGLWFPSLFPMPLVPKLPSFSPFSSPWQ
jgi:hypothetical protein